jgi:hypothetical protein
MPQNTGAFLIERVRLRRKTRNDNAKRMLAPRARFGTGFSGGIAVFAYDVPRWLARPSTSSPTQIHFE